ncbi:hypothetical protein GQ55_9G391700 [Panicum hallii var. hallii]|uniref:Uncharacterized protein n=1 Tax=Panicum hallii var. hallii TaxID=1504633 RepID=A0A2T7C9M7_9POAL|nr:hypothetical protein GQ55_9G391700 [Panicum hallii var. hallii]
MGRRRCPISGLIHAWPAAPPRRCRSRRSGSTVAAMVVIAVAARRCCGRPTSTSLVAGFFVALLLLSSCGAHFSPLLSCEGEVLGAVLAAHLCFYPALA